MTNETLKTTVEEELKKNPIVTVKVKTTGFPGITLQHPSETVITYLRAHWLDNKEFFMEETILLASLTSDNLYKEAFQLLKHLVTNQYAPHGLRFRIIKPIVGSKLWFLSKFNRYSIAINIATLTLNLINWLIAPQTTFLLLCIFPTLCLISSLLLQHQKKFI